MRTAHWKAHLLPLLLLSLHSVSVCLAADCIFDEYTTRFDIKSDIATAAHQPTGQNWEPLRIVTSIKDLQGQREHCENKDDSTGERSTKDADPKCRSFFAPLTPEKTKNVMGILEKAIALHTDRLLVQRAVGPLVIPDFSTHPICKDYNVPADHRTDGVPNADMVLYVASSRDSGDGGGSPSLGMTCAKSAGGRPIAGTFLFGDGNIKISRSTVRLAAHHIAHALGFSYGEMNLRNMIMDKKVRDKPNSVAVVKSEKTKKMAQAHYGCPKAEGMELEGSEENNEKFSHWERRNAKDELMATPRRGSDTLFMGFYTSLTMAAFEDMGYYKANFTMAEHMEYGYNTGCDFLTGKCVENGVTKWPSMLCDDRKSNEGPSVCTTDRLGLGVCALKGDYNPPLPSHFRYVAPPIKGGIAASLTDYCPVMEQDPSFGCTNSAQQGNVLGSLFAENSMCLDCSALKIKTGSDAIPVGAVCAEISCAGGSLKVKYLGDPNTWHDCPEGKSLTPSSTSKSFGSGTIKCPKYKEVCTVALDGSSLVPKVPHEPMEPSASTSPSASPSASGKPTGQTNNPNSGGKSNDSSSVPFGLIPSVALLALSLAGYLIA